MFRKDFLEKGQLKSFCGVGAQHQNAQAEHNIQAIIYIDRTFINNVMLNWSESGVDDHSMS